ncbi:MAG: YihY/virulence factor BrkB family protein, partial [Bacteroidales bacterium]
MQNPHQSAKLIKRISILKRINIYCLQTKRYLKFGVWFYDTQNLPLWKRRSIEGYKILAVAYKKFVQDQCIERSSSLSFYSLMAIVPILAMAFGFAGGFGMTTVLQNLLSNFTPSDAPFWNLILNFSQNMLSNVNGGLIAGIGILVLFWIVMNVITRIEKALNEIWQVKKARTFLRKATDYTTIIVLTPMLLFVAFSAKIYLSAHLQELVNISFFQSFIHIILSTTPIIITFIIIILLYFILPNMRIPLFSAIISGIFSSLLFLLVQSLYVKFQVYMTSYNLIYGSFAALPLFMLWLRFSWIILLLGAELGFSIENYHHYIFETDYKHLSEYRRKIYALFTVNQLVRNFAQRQGAMSVQEIATKIRAPQP